MSIKESKIKFLDKVYELRTQGNISLEELSRRSGVPLEILKELEQGRLPAEMDVGDAYRLAEAFGCKVSELFK